MIPKDDKIDPNGVIASLEAALRLSGLASGDDGPTLVSVRGPARRPPAPAAKRSLAELAAFVERDLLGRCETATGEYAGHTFLRLDPEHVAALKQLSAALAYLAPHDDTIRRSIKVARSEGCGET